MKSKLFLCAALAAALYVTPSYAADYSAQVVSFSHEDPDNLSIELTGSKVITDDFSFKLPSQAISKLIMVPSGDSYEVYEKNARETISRNRFFLELVVAVLMPVIVLGGIYGGIFTAT